MESCDGPAAPDDFELRLFIEEVCCNLCRFHHVERDGVEGEKVRIDQEVYLGAPGAFADIRVQSPGVKTYFVEVKYGYDARRMVASLSRKYGPAAPLQQGADRVVLVVDAHRHADWPQVVERLRESLRPGLTLEVWDEPRLLSMIQQLFGVTLDSISATDLIEAREAIDQTKGRHAFGEQYTGGVLDGTLLWHFGFRRLRRLREQKGLNKRDILSPGLYRDVVALMADLTGFSSYVRDTPEERIVRNCLTAFYAKSRQRIIDAGGMVYQFLGDAVIGFFGVPDRPEGYLRDALCCAAALSDIGNSVSNEWQRQIDRVQPAGGVHIGMALGELQVMSLRPFSRAHIGAVGDSINMTHRLMSCAGSEEVVVSNMLYQRLDHDIQAGFEELAAIEAKNVGRIRAWRMKAACPHLAGA